MCGIVGFNWNDKELVTRLNDLMTYRGPDQSGLYCDEAVSMAHRRLSILDLSEKGRQPMSNEDGTVKIVFNGEIFNYRSLREELTAKGHIFTSDADTEVLVHLYEESGTGMLKRLNGQFAFCVYDKTNKKLFLARDRAGILPLFYYLDGEKFVFSSELKSILASGINKEINAEALALYFRFGYIAAPYCILKNTHKLEPAHFIVYDLTESRMLKHEKYWDVSFKNTHKDVNEVSENVRNELERSVKERLISDVPVGAFLSGGVDSSAVVALIKKHKEQLKTFSIKFDHPEFDESRFARKMSEFFDTEHHEINFSHEDVRSIVPKLVDHFDEPFGDPSAIPTYLVSKVAREHVTVCLSGDGGDELLGGYNRYRYFFVLRVLNLIPKFLKSALRGILNIVIRIYPKFEIERIRELLRFERLDDLELFEKLSEKIDRRDLDRLLKKKVGFTDTTPGIATRKGLAGVLHWDMIHYLEGDILTKVDRASMASSLETRPPFLDHKFIEYCSGIDGRLKIKLWTGKWILKKAFRDILPAEILKRPKMGFGVPIKHYLKNELKDLVEKYVFSYREHDLFDTDFLKGMTRPGRLRDTTRLYWNVMVFNMWHEKWMR